jgi:phosphoserine phosphatase
MVHIFDVDYTILKKSTSYYFLLEALKEKAVTFNRLWRLPVEWLRYKLGYPNQDFIQEAVKYLSGIDEQLIINLSERCFTKRIKSNIYAEGYKLISDIQKRGDEALFATSAFHTLIGPLEKFFGIKDSLASTLEFSNGKTTGCIVGKAFFGENKKHAVHDWLEKRG